MDGGVPMDMDEPVAEDEEEIVTMDISEYHFLCDELAYLRFELIDQRREAWEEKFLAYQ
jgi:hypothetical protein